MNPISKKNSEQHSLGVIINKLNKSEPNTVGNYYVDLNEIIENVDHKK
jgi:hypothetical protein